MILNIYINELETIDIDTDALPTGQSSKSLMEDLEEYNITSSELHRIAMAYHRAGLTEEFYRWANKIAKNSAFSISHAFHEAIYDACLVMRNKKPEYLGEEPIFDIIKGIVKAREKEFPAANFYFSRCKFEEGLEVIDFLEGRKKLFSNEKMNLLSGYVQGRERLIYTKNFDLSDALKIRIDKDIRKLIIVAIKEFLEKGKVENVKSEDGEIDIGKILVGVIKNPLLNKNVEIVSTICEEMINFNMELAESLVENIENISAKGFLKGKILHLKGDFDGAAREYEKSDYILARYNRNRILQNEFIDFGGRFLDFSSYMSRRMGKKTISSDLQNVFDAIEDPCIHTLRKILDSKFVEKWRVLNNIAFEMWLEIDKLKCFSNSFKIISGLNDEKDVSPVFLSLSEMNVNSKNYDEKIAIQEKRIEKLYEEAILLAPDDFKIILNSNLNLMRNKEIEQALLERDNEKIDKCGSEEMKRFYAYLIHNVNEKDDIYYGFSLIDKYLESRNKALLGEAFELFLRFDSIYALNGIAVILILQKDYKKAMALLKKLVCEFPMAAINLGNLYVILERYDEALVCFNSVPLSKYTEKMINLLENV